MGSVLVPARDERANLKRLLPTLFEQRYPRFEVRVYEDQSVDGTSDVLDAVKGRGAGRE